MSTMTPLLFVVEPADPSVTPCETHTWEIEHQDGIVWRMCTVCSLTECTVPGIDRCLHLGMEETPRVVFLSMTPIERMFASTRGSHCRRLTSGRCPHCHLGMCSDHMPFHLDWCAS